MTEGEYLSTMDSYKDSLRSVGINPDIFTPDVYISNIEGDVSGLEFWQERVLPAHERVIERGQGMIDRYATDWGIEMTPEALIASLLDPDRVGSMILNRQIGISEIRFAADEALGTGTTNRYQTLLTDLYETEGMTYGQAQDLFRDADAQIPALSILASRHADPDDDFDLEEFTAATIYNDPEQARRMRRLIAQERSLFTGGKLTNFANSQATGGISGLDQV